MEEEVAGGGAPALRYHTPLAKQKTYLEGEVPGTEKERPI
jgi:hypothetical protein